VKIDYDDGFIARFKEIFDFIALDSLNRAKIFRKELINNEKD